MSYHPEPNPITQQILQAAATLLARIGDGFTMDQLAEQAKVPRATIYRRVGSKIALLEQLAQEHGLTLSPQRSVHTRIIQSARRIFGRAGLVNATIEQIATEAQVGVATIYRHFGDKEHLVWAVVEELSPRAILRDLVAPSADVAADLLSLTTLFLPLFYENRDILRIILTGNEAERAYVEKLRVGSDHTLDQMVAYFTTQTTLGRLQATGEPRQIALAYLGLLLTFTVIGPAHYGISLEQPAQIAELIVQIFLRGVQRHA